MRKSFLIWAAILGASATALGAWGAHSLPQLVDEIQANSFKTGTTYQFYYTLALLAVVLVHAQLKNKFFVYAGYAFIVGILMFSGSIYLLSTKTLSGIAFPSIMGLITPFGGLTMILGWVFFLVGAMQYKKQI